MKPGFKTGPDSCEPAVTSPSASSVADSWSARSTSIATTASGSPFPYRIPIVKGECDFISALAGKRIWRFSAADKASYLDFLDMADPQRLLQTPPTRGASIHNWIADIPTPRTPSPAPPSRLRDLTPSPLSSSFFSSSLGSPKDLDTQAHGLPTMSPSQEFSPACQASPSSQASSDGWLFAPRRFFVGRASPAASPSIRTSSPVARSSPAPAASSTTPRSAPAASPSPSPATKLPDALCKLQALLEAGSPQSITRSPSPSPDNKLPVALSNLQALLDAGSPQPIIRSSPPVFHSTLTTTASPEHQASPLASPSTHIHSSPAVTRSMTPAQPVCRKRKLAADASPAPLRPRPAAFTRFEPPTAFRFSPALPGTLLSLPPPGPSMPGSFPTTIRVEPLAPAAPSTPAPGFPWKTVAGVAVGAA
ncbi:hypothetical protein VSDG_04877 [Cytospora chrysosperma]|uniref:Uncharacterized protein n=1 Tax=Cytospora chrysosperma TaxID=252740 RepID=A0A423W3T0_CYTCH|nr:hypothetical protein VSDG_04877 [Valsa sordida]